MFFIHTVVSHIYIYMGIHLQCQGNINKKFNLQLLDLPCLAELHALVPGGDCATQ